MHLNTIRTPSPIANMAPATAPEGLSDTARDEARFATLLRQNQAAAAQARATPPAPHPEAAPRPAHGGKSSPSGGTKDADSAAPESPPDTPASRSASARESDNTPAADATQRARQAQAPDDAEASPPKKGSARGVHDDQPAPIANAGADPAVPDANPWLAPLQLTGRVPIDPATPNGNPSAGSGDAAASNSDALSQASSAADLRASREHAAMLKADAQDAAALVDPGAAADADAKVAGFAATLVEQLEAAKGDAPRTAVEGAKPGTAVLAMTATPTGAATANPLAATPTLTLATPVDSPDFAQALGVQLSVLARDGVQHAELHLNPADMGPVSVHIVMQGTQAHIDFGADLAATRQAIENGLPGLAGAMRDAGFTLAGGGVSQHSSHRDDGNGTHGSAPRRVDGREGGRGDDMSAGHVRRHTVRAGGVDLYA
jgi:flagellar hook-length control protein FliK